MKNLIKLMSVSLWLILLSLNVSYAQCDANYLSASGNKLYDAQGNVVRLTGINWFGFETSNRAPHGLWSRDCKSMLIQIKDLGFNAVRIPWSNAILEPGASMSGISNAPVPDAYTGRILNEVESTLTNPLDLLDMIVDYCQELNLKIILDNHSRQPDGYLSEELWYTDITPHEKWISDWVFLADRYKDKDAVIGMDINNEPHGKNGNGSRWGSGTIVNDWRLAAEECGNAILQVNPNVLIMVEGVEEFEGETYWWGGNLKGAASYPVRLSDPSKLVYSPHEYGPTVFNQTWFSAPDFPNNMPGIWEENFNYLHTQNVSPMFAGEFGIKFQGGVDEVWFDAYLEFMGEKGYSWTFWSWNPNSGDTGGILTDDWSTTHDWKMNKLIPHLDPEIPNGTGVACGNTFKITASAGVGGTITPSGEVSVAEESNRTFTISPTSGFAIADVVVDGSSVGAVSSYTFTGLSSDHTISATFSESQLASYTITSSAGTGGTISPNGSTAVNEGDDQTYVITPSPGYVVASVEVDGIVVNAVGSYTFNNVTQDHSITATFGPNNSSGQYPAGSPVAINGKLSVAGGQLVNQCGNSVQLRGMSTHGPQWFENCYTTSSMDALVNDWGIDVYRIAMYVEEGGYVNNPDYWKAWIDQKVDETAERGVYCMIDWHVLNPGDPNANLDAARDFWSYMSAQHNGKDHVIYEIANEPNGVNWPTVKSYAEDIIPRIRANDPSTIIIVGTPTWSQDVDVAAQDPLNYTNLMYALHFYSGTHTQWLRDKAQVALNAGLALFVTEFGTSRASGDGGPFLEETQNWMDWMANNDISWINWSFADKAEVSAALAPGSCSGGSWTNTSVSGAFIKDHILVPADNFNCQTGPTYTISASAGAGGTISPDGNVVVNEGADQSFTITPASGFVIEDVTVDGSSVGPVGTYTFTNVQANHSISATFTGNGNTSPIAVLDANITTGEAPLDVQFNATNSSDADNDPLSFSWDFGDGTSGTGISTSHTYTSAGVFTATLTVSDGNGGSDEASVIITVTAPPLGCNFGTPLNGPLSSGNTSYSNIHVLGTGGPDLSNVTNFVINWDLQNNGLWQFSMNTNNGIPNWYTDLRSFATHTFGNTQPDISLSGSGFAGLDGDYFVNFVNDDFVMVSKTGGFVIYYSNSATPPTCVSNTTGRIGDTSQPVRFEVTDDNRLMLTERHDIRSVTLTNLSGQELVNMVSIQSGEVTLNKNLAPGIYLLKVNRREGINVLKVYKK